MKIAIEGCAHGELEKIYETITSIEQKENIKVDLLLCCGDFQSTRNNEDLQTMAVPEKYLDICTFYKYYSGELLAPILTIFVGGNHEASNYLQELPYGGWVAPNIYYLGYAGVVRVNGVRIAGLSGIQKDGDYLRGRFEFAPYTESTKRSVYHVRQLEVFRLKQLSGRVDVFLSHDWPRGIHNYGNKEQLLRFKPHFREDIENEQLGSKPCMELLLHLKPSLWFAAHLHCKFAALVAHEVTANESEQSEKPNVTKFLALDKCLPQRRFLQIYDIETDAHEAAADLKFEYDLEWLAILQLTNHLLSVKKTFGYMPGPSGENERYNFTPTTDELEQTLRKLDGDLSIPQNFCRTVEPFKPEDLAQQYTAKQPKALINPQSVHFCDLLGLDDPVSLAMLIDGKELNHSINLDESASSVDVSGYCSSLNSSCLTNEQEISPKVLSRIGLNLPAPSNEEEIALNGDFEPDTRETVVEECIEKTKVEADNSEFDKETADTKVNEETPIKKFKRRNQNEYKEEEVDYGSL